MSHENYNFFIYGCGGHAKVIIHTIRSLHKNANINLYDDNEANYKMDLLGCSVIGGRQQLINDLSTANNFKLLIAIGNNAVRRQLFGQFDSLAFAKVQHSSAVIDSSSHIGAGSVVFASSVVHPCCDIGKNVIVNTGAIIDHDCIVEDHAQIAPGAVLCGGVKVGKASMICAGATIIPDIKIGKNVTVAAGAVVTQDVPDNIMVAGVPALLKKELAHV